MASGKWYRAPRGSVVFLHYTRNVICYSDDDLEPYDMSHDQKKTDQKMPLYLRDCMEGNRDLEKSGIECHNSSFAFISLQV